MEDILTAYTRRLTNLSGNNRSLFLKQLAKEQFIDLHEFDFVDNKPSFEIVSKLIAQHSHIKLTTVVDSRTAAANQLAMRLQKIQRNEKQIFEERGSRDLYVGWPFIRGKFNDNTPVNAPLIFFPITLCQKSDHWAISYRKDVNITLNKTFILAYAYYNQLAPDEILLESILTDFEKDDVAFRTAVYELLKKSSLEINFNQELFLNQLVHFESLKKETFDKEEKTGRLKLYSQAVMGIFPQSGSYLLPDYMHMLIHDKFSDFEDFFFRKTLQMGKSKTAIDLAEDNTFTPFEMDAYQERALKSVKKGQSIVVQGPPGTGKSQLIANLICDYMARGKSILLVSQKKAALDVVYDRLKQFELHDFVGQVHDFKNDRKFIYEKIANQIARLEEYQQKNNGLDTIHLERTFNLAGRTIDMISEELETYHQALFDEQECGKSIKELYLTQQQDQPVVHLSQQYQAFRYPGLETWLTKMKTHYQYQSHFDEQDHYWSEGKSFKGYNPIDRIYIKEALDTLKKKFEQFQISANDILNGEPDYDTLEHFYNKKEQIAQFIEIIGNTTVYEFFSNMLENPPDENYSWLTELERTILLCFKGHGLELSLKSDELGRFQESLEKAIKARKGLISWIQWSLFSKDRIFNTRVLVANKLKSNREGYQILVERIDNRLNYEHNMRRLEEKPWLRSFPTSARKMQIQNWFFYARLAYKTLEIFKEIKILDSFINFNATDKNNLIQELTVFHKLINEFPDINQEASKYLTDQQIRLILMNKKNISEIVRILDDDFEDLCSYHQLKSTFSFAESEVLQLLENIDGETSDKIACFENSLALAWINHIETKHPVLRMVSSLEFDQKIQTLREAVRQKNDTSRSIVLLKCREKTYEGLNYNRQNNRVTYRDLDHQVNKKRKMWPLRKLLADYQEEVFQLIPCWMTSPESASAIFPMMSLFDLVVFDEASQCFVERGIPAMYRGKQVVVAGDEKQLQPFDLYQIRWEDDIEDTDPDIEITSLLDLAKRYLPDTLLQSHYRSKSMALIAFSNQHFYQQKLSLLPDRLETIENKQPITYHLVAGAWENNTNLLEAKKAVEIAIDLVRKNLTVGIITFNAPQQSLIMDLFDQSGLSSKKAEQIKVKNIENVQGDEYDMVIFSLGYAADSKGKLQFKFGLLNLPGGENRLNVAITRAKYGIHLVTSLKPAQFAKMDAKNEGPKLLAKYLAFAWEVSNQNWQVQPLKLQNHPISWYLKSQLQMPVDNEIQLEAKPAMPFADLTIYAGKEPAGLIITDDDLYFESFTPKQYFVDQPEQFQQKNWPAIQLFSRDFWQRKNVMMDRLRIFTHRFSTAKK